MDRRAVVTFAFLALVALAGCAGLADTGTPTDAGPGAGNGGASGHGITVGGTLVPGTNTVAPGEGVAVTVTRVVDGDTVDVRYANGSTDTVRLLGVDTPEVNTENDPAEFEGVPDTGAGRDCLRSAGESASAFAERLLAGEEVTLVVDETADRRGGYGRLLAYVHVDGVEFNYQLLAGGYARVYDSTFSRSERYYATESRAQSSTTGLWACRTPGGTDSGTEGDGSDSSDAGGEAAAADTGLVLAAINADAPGNDHENPNGESLVFRNDGSDPLGLGGWTVRDAADHVYTVPDGVTLAAGETLTLRTGRGENTADTLYWGRDRAVWNNGGDTVVVARDGEILLRAEYG